MEARDVWICVRGVRSRSRTDLWWKWWTNLGMKAACSAVYVELLYRDLASVKTENSTAETTTKSKYAMKCVTRHSKAASKAADSDEFPFHISTSLFSAKFLLNSIVFLLAIRLLVMKTNYRFQDSCIFQILRRRSVCTSFKPFCYVTKSSYCQEPMTA